MFAKIYRLHFAILSLFSLSLSVYSQHKQSKANTIYVNPFIGTTKSNVLTSWGGNGGTYPGAVAPSGNIQLTPETRVTGAKGYDYSDQQIFFFSCFKHFSGFPEGSSGQVFILPVEKGKIFEPGKYSRPFNHTQEEATPGYYKVVFNDDKTIAEAAASTHTGILKFTFPANKIPKIYIGGMGKITITGKRIVHGDSGNIVINLSSDIIESKAVTGGYLLTINPSLASKESIELKISASTVSLKGAQQNIDTEINDLDFQAFRKRTEMEWDNQLATVDVTDPSLENKKVFYTALYHSLLIPWVISDTDGKYKGADGKIYQTKAKNEYGGFSPWDTFRTLHPLLTLLYPEKQTDVILSMLDVYKQTGTLPTESMTGNHSVPIIVDAYLKGITGFDSSLAYTAMKKSIMEGPFAKNDMEVYHQKGYVPFSKPESVTKTVEYAYDDWALAQFAKRVMNNHEDGQLLEKRGLNYRNLFNPDNLFLLPRADNVFKLNPGMTGYKEGDKWIYTYFVPHNAKDLVNLLGGKDAFCNRLDSALSNHTILYDNETVLHLPYLFNAAGRPDLTQKWIRNIMINRFSATPGGLPGNDDLGSMSSAYIFNALGLFPLSPGNPEYAIGSPLFESITLHLPGNKNLSIKASKLSAENKYIQSLSVNNHLYSRLSIPHHLLTTGGQLNFVMSPKAIQEWPTDRNPIILSASKEDAAIRVLKYSISKKEVHPNEVFQVYFSLKNEGSLGTKQVIVYANGKPFASKSILVKSNSETMDSISCRLYALGKTRIGISPSTNTLIQVRPAIKSYKSSFQITKLAVIPTLKLNTRQKINYQIKNITGIARTFKPKFYLADDLQNKTSLLYTDLVYLQPGQQINRTYQFTVHKNGMYTIKAENTQQKFKVYDSPSSCLLLDLQLKNLKGNQIADVSGFHHKVFLIEPESVINVQTATETSTALVNAKHLEVENAPALDEMENSLTMMAWVYPVDEEKGLTDILTKGDSHVLQTKDDETLTFFAGGWGRGDCTVKLPADWKKKWHHIAGVCKGNVLTVYIDGKLAGHTTVEGSVNLSSINKWQAGCNEEFPSERIFHGRIDGIKVYGQPLSTPDISHLFEKEKKQYFPD